MERCPECGSWEACCVSEEPVPDCWCARCAGAEVKRLKAELDDRCTCTLCKFGFEESRVEHPLCPIHGDSPKKEIERLRAELEAAKEQNENNVAMYSEQVARLNSALHDAKRDIERPLNPKQGSIC